MIAWALTFLVVAVASAFFGFGNLVGQIEVAKLVFFVAIVLFSISAVVGLLRGDSPAA